MKSRVMNFYNLDAWKKGHELVLEIYKITSTFPKEERFGIVSQTQRTSSSITVNIAEGFARHHFKDKQRFYYQARGSAVEVFNFLFLARDLKYIDSDICGDMENKLDEVIKLINGLIKSINNQTCP